MSNGPGHTTCYTQLLRNQDLTFCFFQLRNIMDHSLVTRWGYSGNHMGGEDETSAMIFPLFFTSNSRVKFRMSPSFCSCDSNCLKIPGSPKSPATAVAGGLAARYGISFTNERFTQRTSSFGPLYRWDHWPMFKEIFKTCLLILANATYCSKRWTAWRMVRSSISVLMYCFRQVVIRTGADRVRYQVPGCQRLSIIFLDYGITVITCKYQCNLPSPANRKVLQP